nr:hypothetical protein [uncultured Draconibacterium sp.]
MENKVPDIILVYPTEIPDEIIEKELEFLNHDKHDIKVLKTDNNTFMAFEWIVPTAFIVYLLKPYFNAFLSEAGKDHYHITKKGLKKLVEKAKLIKAKFLTAEISSKKLSKNYSQSIVFSIIFQTQDNRPIKLLFDNEMELSDWENAIDELIELILENYKSSPNDKLSKMMDGLGKEKGDEIYAVINSASKQLELLDNYGMMKKYK